MVVALYAPSGIITERQELRQSFFRNLRNEIGLNTTRNDNAVLLGDFNSTLNTLDRSTNELGIEAKSELEK